MAGSASFLWVVAGLIGLATVAPGIDQVVSDATREQSLDGTLVPRAADGQFYFEAKAGDLTVRFLVDGGIDDIVLAGADAERAGLSAVAEPRLAELKLGSKQLSDVPVRVAPDLPVSLIGRSYLIRAAGADFPRDQMVLR